MSAQRSIVICGGAFAGLALALALRQGLGREIPVIVADPALNVRPSRDPRATAIVAACRRLFDVIGVWGQVAEEAQPILDMVVTDSKLDLLQGTLDLMVLQTLSVMGSQHGYGIARRIEQISDDAVLLNQGTIYASLVRLQHRGWIDAEWGVSDNNRKAKYYSITRGGRKQLAKDAAYWQRLSDLMGRVLTMEAESGDR